MTTRTPATPADKLAFIDECAILHPRGREAAVRAMEMGLAPDDYHGAQTYSRDNPELMPSLNFDLPSGQRVVVAPLPDPQAVPRVRGQSILVGSA
jgi:hypothetical protein